MGSESNLRGKAKGFFRLGAVLLALARIAWAQTPPVPEPSVPSPSAPSEPAPAAPPGATSRESELDARVRQLEVMIQQMNSQGAGRAGGLSSDPRDSSDNAGNGATVGGGGPRSGGPVPPGGSGGPAGGSTGGGVPVSDAPGTSNGLPAGAGPGGNSPTGAPSTSGGALAPGQSSPPNPPPSDRFNMPPTTINSPLTGRFGPGFELKTADDEFVAQWHNLTQFDGRFFVGQGTSQSPVKDTFVIPREWWMLSGRITKPFEYFLSFQNAFDTINMLDVFLNIHYDDRVQFKIGRYKTPFTYEFYTEPIQGLIQPERSLFFNNFALNRSLGMMTWGRLFNTTAPLDYAVGIFNSTKNSYLDASDAKNVLAFLNWRPFALQIDSPLENLVFGGSVMAGSQTSTPIPATLRTQVPTTGNQTIGVDFLTFNSNVRESGPRAFWDLHAAWYYRQLSLIAEWQSGYQDYALATSLASHNRIGVDSYYVQAGYFITGETVSGRNVVKPIRDFDIRKGRLGPGAIELTGRFNSLNLSRNVFSAGLADPNLWTNNLYTTDVGFNWYLTQYFKLYFNWEHAVFGTAVQASPTSAQKTNDMLWFRFQLYF